MIRIPTNAWFFVLLGLCVGCASHSSGSKRSEDTAGPEDESCPRGSKGCRCTEAGYCDSGLVCRSNECVKRASAARDDNGAWDDGSDESGDDDDDMLGSGGAGINGAPGANAGSSPRGGQGGAAGTVPSENGGLAHTGGAVGLGGFSGNTPIGGAVSGLGGSTGVGGTVIGEGARTGVGGAVSGLGGSAGVGGFVVGVGGSTGVGGFVVGVGGSTGVGGFVIGLGGSTATGGTFVGSGGVLGIGGFVIGLGGGSGTGGTATGGAAGAPACDPAFSSDDACGGNEQGTWTLEEACTDSDLLDELQSACEGAMGQDYRTASGTLILDGESFSRSVYVYDSIDLQVPEGNACLAEGAVTCSELGTLLAAIDSDLEAFCVSDDANGCDCVFVRAIESSSSGAYTVNGSNGKLTFNDGEQVFDYCVQGELMTLRDTDSTGSEAGIVQLYTRLAAVEFGGSG
jgi:hypothetical protein